MVGRNAGHHHFPPVVCSPNDSSRNGMTLPSMAAAATWPQIPPRRETDSSQPGDHQLDGGAEDESTEHDLARSQALE